MATASDSCTLLSLPGELRNRIYRYTLGSPQAIAVSSKGYERSGLLSACRQIRHEALQIFYHENAFDIAALELDSCVLAQWCAVLDKLDINPRRVTMCPSIRQTAHWRNLMTWIYQWHVGVIPARLTYPAYLHNAEVRLVHAMFDTAMIMQGQPWSHVKLLLDIQRPVLIALNPDWAIER